MVRFSIAVTRILAAALLTALAGAAAAQEFPNKPIRIVVPDPRYDGLGP